MKLEVPDEIISMQDYSESAFKIDVAVLLYQRKVMTLARAARWVSMTRLQFQKALVDRGVPVHYSIQDFETDLKSLQSMPS